MLDRFQSYLLVEWVFPINEQKNISEMYFGLKIPQKSTENYFFDAAINSFF